jgi:uncharacterized protein YacL
MLPPKPTERPPGLQGPMQRLLMAPLDNCMVKSVVSGVLGGGMGLLFGTLFSSMAFGAFSFLLCLFVWRVFFFSPFIFLFSPQALLAICLTFLFRTAREIILPLQSSSGESTFARLGNRLFGMGRVSALWASCLLVPNV